MEKAYQVIILVGGVGKRTYPLTKEIPKALVPVNGKPILEIKINYLKKWGFKNIILCVGYKGNLIERYFKDGKDFGVNIQYSYEEELLGTGGAIKNAEHLIRGDFIAMNGDDYILLDFDRLLDFHHMHNAEITMVVSKASNPREQEIIELDNYKIVRIYKRGTVEHADFLEQCFSPLINGGTYVINKDLLKEIPIRRKISLEHEIFPILIGRMHGFLYEGYQKDITSIGDSEKIREEIRKHSLPI